MTQSLYISEIVGEIGRVCGIFTTEKKALDALIYFLVTDQLIDEFTDDKYTQEEITNFISKLQYSILDLKTLKRYCIHNTHSYGNGWDIKISGQNVNTCDRDLFVPKYIYTTYGIQYLQESINILIEVMVNENALLNKFIVYPNFKTKTQDIKILRKFETNKQDFLKIDYYTINERRSLINQLQKHINNYQSLMDYCSNYASNNLYLQFLIQKFTLDCLDIIDFSDW